MADKKIEIKIQTTADTSGAENAQEEIKKVGESAEEASRGFDPILNGESGADPFEEWTEGAEQTTKALEETGQVVGDTTKELKKLSEGEKEATKEIEELTQQVTDQGVAQEKAAKSAEQQAQSLKKIEAAGRALVGLQLAEYFQRALTEVRELAAEGGALHEELGHLSPALDAASASVGVFATGLGTLAATGNPVAAVIAAGSQAALQAVSAYGEMKKAQDRLADAPREFAENQAFAREQRILMEAQLKREDGLNVLTREADEAERQVRALEQANALRASLNNAAMRQAQAEVSIARSTGGDVGLAQTNALVVKLRSELEQVNGQVSEAKARSEAANAASADAVARAQEASQTAGLHVNELNRINTAADQAISEATEADRALARTITEADATKTTAIREVEAALAEINGRSQGLTDQARAAGDKLFTQLQTEMQNIGNQVPAVSGQAAAPVVAKLGEISKGLESERQNTVSEISKIPIPTEHVAAVQASQEKVNGGMVALGNIVISGNTDMASSLERVMQELVRMNSQNNGKFEALWSRIRSIK